MHWDAKLRSPLHELGVDVKEGEFLLAINGQPVNEMRTPYEALVNQAGKQVILKVNAEPKEKGSRDVVVVPIDNEAELYYHEWVSNNIKKIYDATDGKVGYVHVPDMQAAD